MESLRTVKLVNGKAEIPVCGSKNAKNGFVFVTVKSDDKVYYQSPVSVIYASSGKIGTLRLRNTTGDPGLWEAAFNLTNICNDRSISGEIEIGATGQKSVSRPWFRRDT